MNETKISVIDLLNAQTGKLAWDELARHFARGRVICVDPSEDLVEVAGELVGDSVDTIKCLQREDRLKRADDHDAMRWQQEKAIFWAVVVAPWVLVQEIET